MKHLLNYKFEIFPTAPQKKQLNRILRESRLQWNKAVTIRKKLKSALNKGQFEHVINTCLKAGEDKSDNNANRKKAIFKLQEKFPSIGFETASKLYDIKNIAGNLLDLEESHLDISVLASELKKKYDAEIAARKEKKAQGIEPAKLPKLTVYWQLLRAINQYAGYAAKVFMDNSFKSPKGMALSTVRFNISGSKNALRWNVATSPTKEQRRYGAMGDPQYKKRGDSFAYQAPNVAVEKVILKNKDGHNVFLNTLPAGMEKVKIAYHREIPQEGRIKLITVSSKAGRYFVVFSTEVLEKDWAIIPKQEGWVAGIDPGASTALTIGLFNYKTGELRQLAFHYEFLERSLAKLEKMQQSLSLKQGTRRKRTAEEVAEALDKFTAKKAVKKLSDAEREKEIAKEKERLEKRMLRQEPSKRWLKWTRRVSELQFRISNQRNDVLHKISRALAEGCDFVGLGHWEPEREISYRKKLRALKKKVRMGIEGAEKEINSLMEEKSKQGRKGVKKIRRGGRDRSIATLRSRIEEKTQRSNVQAFMKINESGSTLTCCSCEEPTGPKGDLSVRAWQCSNCNAVHHRDLNGSYNILKAGLKYAAAQAATSETGSTVVRTMAQGALNALIPALGNKFHATGLQGRDDTNIQEQALTNVPNLLERGMTKALNSLFEMGIAGPVKLQTETETSSKSPPA